MDKYILFVLLLFIVGAFIFIIQIPPMLGFFYIMIGGAIIIIIYDSITKKYKLK